MDGTVNYFRRRDLRSGEASPPKKHRVPHSNKQQLRNMAVHAVACFPLVCVVTGAKKLSRSAQVHTMPWPHLHRCLADPPVGLPRPPPQRSPRPQWFCRPAARRSAPYTPRHTGGVLRM